jgi:hypothetical protein
MAWDDTPGGAHLKLCDACCDKSGTLKEMVKTGGCTCDVCGFACACCAGDGRQFVNRVLARNVPADGWAVLQERNRRSLIPLDWEALFRLGRE